MKKEVRRIAILVSGFGTMLQAIIDAVRTESLDTDIVIVVSSNKNAFALRRAERANIKCHVLTSTTEEDRDEELYNVLKEANADLVVSAGYLRIIGSKVLGSFTAINTHPSLLPKYCGKCMYGVYVHQAIVDNKERESGATVHFVNEEYNKGQIIWQTHVPVYPEDTAKDVCKRVQAVEKPQLVSILRAFSEGKIDIPD